MNKILLILGFVVMVGIQWFVPGSMIHQQEDALKHGKAYKFKTRPIDPSDPFRGKFIVLNYELSSFSTKDTLRSQVDKVYVYINVDSAGYAQVTAVSEAPKSLSEDFIIAEYSGYYNGAVHFYLPFDRYYMDEEKALNAEVSVRNIQRRADSLSPVCYALVYVKNDVAVLDNVFIGNVSVKDLPEYKE